MNDPRILLSATTIALLATHQVDASFQREWELFGVPGGIDFFLFFNFSAVLVLLVSLVKRCSGVTLPSFWRFIVPGTGIGTVGIHALYLSSGRPEFSQTSSIIILGLLLVSSVSEVYFGLRPGSK